MFEKLAFKLFLWGPFYCWARARTGVEKRGDLESKMVLRIYRRLFSKYLAIKDKTKSKAISKMAVRATTWATARTGPCNIAEMLLTLIKKMPINLSLPTRKTFWAGM